MIILPFFGSNPPLERRLNLDYALAWYRRFSGYDVCVLTTSSTPDLPTGTQYLVVDDEGLRSLSKSFVLRKGLEMIPNGSPVLFIDNDMLLSEKTITRFFSEIRPKLIIKPYRDNQFLTKESSARLREEGVSSIPNGDLPDATKLWSVYYNQGGSWGFIKEDDGMIDLASPSIYGWGVEDSLFSIVAFNLGYDTIHLHDETMLHLWHPYWPNTNSSAEHNSCLALQYLLDLDANGYRRSTRTFAPTGERDQIDQSIYRCDQSTLFNLIGDCYFRVLGYSHQLRSRPPAEPALPRPRLTLASIAELFDERGVSPQALLGPTWHALGTEAKNPGLKKLDRIYRKRHPASVPTAVDVKIPDVLEDRRSRLPFASVMDRLRAAW